MHSQKITKRIRSRAQSMVSRCIQNMPWRIKTSLKLKEQGMGTEDWEGCSIPISSEQFSKGLASSDVVVATKLLSFPHKSRLCLPGALYAAKELVDRLLAAAASWKVLQLIQHVSGSG